MNLQDLKIDQNWTLFLDRDGVINKKLDNDYVKHWIEFQFLEGVFDALKKCDEVFGKILIVTNQQGIGKGIYRTEDLELIHKNMMYEISYFKGRIDKVYHSPYLATENHPTRKPGIGMAEQARKDFPEIDFEKSLIVGDSISDMQFGRNAGMKTVYINENNPTPEQSQLIDFQYSSLNDFVKNL
jgi:histidinol-phosphate phosphatase family protein